MAKIPPARPKSHTNRSSTRPPRRGGLVIAPPPEVYATIPAVHPQEWMRVLTWALTLPSVERRRRRMKISSPTTIHAVASSLASSADYRTGRNVAVTSAPWLEVSTGWAWRRAGGPSGSFSTASNCTTQLPAEPLQACTA